MINSLYYFLLKFYETFPVALNIEVVGVVIILVVVVLQAKDYHYC